MKTHKPIIIALFLAIICLFCYFDMKSTDYKAKQIKFDTEQIQAELDDIQNRIDALRIKIEADRVIEVEYEKNN